MDKNQKDWIELAKANGWKRRFSLELRCWAWIKPTAENTEYVDFILDK